MNFSLKKVLFWMVAIAITAGLIWLGETHRLSTDGLIRLSMTAALIIGLVYGFLSEQGNMVKQLIVQAYDELFRISYPQRSDVISTGLIVAIMTIIMSFLLFLLDGLYTVLFSMIAL